MAAAAADKPTIAIVYYTTWGHMAAMAKSVAKGVEAAGATAKLYQVPETLPEEVLKAMHAAPKDAAVPVVTLDDLVKADGILFGIPTRYGTAAAQVKTLFDSTGGLWKEGKLVGKPAGVFFGSGTQGGGQETTALTTYTYFTHHGMVIVPLGYASTKMFDNSFAHGGSPYGAGYLSGDGSRAVSEYEHELAELQGKNFTNVATALWRGRK